MGRMFTLLIPEEDVRAIGKALAEAPYKVAMPILARIQKQIDEQQKPQDSEKTPAITA